MTGNSQSCVGCCCCVERTSSIIEQTNFFLLSERQILLTEKCNSSLPAECSLMQPPEHRRVADCLLFEAQLTPPPSPHATRSSRIFLYSF